MFLFESSQQKRLRTDMEKQMEICLSNTQKYQEAMEAISKNINNQKIIQLVVDNIKATIKDSDYQPIRKFQSIRLLRDLMRTQNKNLGKYVVKKILKRLTILAEHKSESGDQDRGKDIFGKVKKDQEQYSIKFLNQLLRAIEQWGKNWPKVSQGTHQQFHKAYKDLVINGIRFPKQETKLNQNAYRNSRQESLNKYSSVPASFGNRGSIKIQQTSPKPSGPEKKITYKPPIQPKKSSLNFDKINKYFQQIISTSIFLKETLSQADEQMWPTIKDIIEQLSQNIALGNQFIAQLTQKGQNNQNQVEIKNKIQQCFDYSHSILKDMKKADRNPTQFGAFKNKYIKTVNKVIDSLEKRSKTFKIPEIKQQIKPSFQQKSAIDSQIKRLSVPIVKTGNQYNSRSGKDGWVIKQHQQFNSNSHKSQNDQHANPTNFGSFGVGGIGQKSKKMQSSDQKKHIENQSNIQVQNIFKVSTERKVQKKFSQQKNKIIKTQTAIQQKFQKQLGHQNKGQQKGSEFGGFQLSGDKEKPHQQQVFDQPAKSNHQKTKNMFNDSDFKQKSIENDKSKDSADFFQQIKKNNQQTGNRLPTTKRTKTINQEKNQQLQNVQNPFAIQMNSQIQSEGLSAFNKDKSQHSIINKSNPFESQNKSKILINNQKIPQRKNSALSGSFEGNPFQANNLKNPWDQSFQKKSDNPFQEKKSITSKQSKKSSVNNFDFNKSLSKSERSNPFQSSTHKDRKKSQAMSNPFTSDNNNNSQIGGEKSNPFETTIANQQFNPPQTNNIFDSVSQRNSFKKIQIGSIKGFQVQNPFQTGNNFDPVRDSWKLEPRNIEQNESGVNFDAFQQIPKKGSPRNYQPKRLSNSFQNSGKFGQNFNPKQSQDRSIHFSEFGQQQQQNLSKIFKNGSIIQGQQNKSVNFDNFNDFQKNRKQSLPESKQQKQVNQFSAFDITKNSKDFQQKQQLGSRSGFSGFNLTQRQNQNNSGIQFNNFQNLQTKNKFFKRNEQFDEKSQSDRFDLKLSLRSNNYGQYPNSSQSNQKNEQKNKDQKVFNISQTNRKNQQSLSIKLQDFSPVGKKGNPWDPLNIQGIKNLSRVYNITDYELSEKTKKMLQLKKTYQQQLKHFQSVKTKQLQSRKLNQQKYSKINDMISQVNSYKNILQKLKQTNHIKQEQIDLLNQKIKIANSLKQKILEKQKQLFQLMKSQKTKQQKKEIHNRNNAQKWEIFNRNLQQMRNSQQSKYYTTYNNISKFV